NIQIEGPLTKSGRENEIRNLASLFRIVGQLVSKEDQQKRHGRQPLLAVDDELLTVLVTDDDRAEEVVAVLGQGGALVAGLVAFEEFICQIVHEFSDML